MMGVKCSAFVGESASPTGGANDVVVDDQVWEFVDLSNESNPDQEDFGSVRGRKRKRSSWLDFYLGSAVCLLGLMGVMSLSGAEELFGKPIPDDDVIVRSNSHMIGRLGRTQGRSRRALRSDHNNAASSAKGRRFQSPYAPQSLTNSRSIGTAAKKIPLPKPLLKPKTIDRLAYVPAGIMVAPESPQIRSVPVPVPVRVIVPDASLLLPVLPVQRPLVVTTVKTYTDDQRSNLRALVKRRSIHRTSRSYRRRKAALRVQRYSSTAPRRRGLGLGSSEPMVVAPRPKRAKSGMNAEWPRWAKKAMWSRE